ncbi:MAG: hemerythrin family protein [Candidatus Pelethousia sp.]|nr:hemerythrin family protein [Candidatus Pelethousia sp.]
MAYQFTKDLETGNALIDSQHHQLINAINELLAACAEGRGRNQLADSAKFLSDYTAKHFGDEEKLQLQYKYPDMLNHKRYHEAFKKTVADISKRLDQEGPSIILVGQMNTALAGWLINHIKREDVKVAAHIRSQQA